MRDADAFDSTRRLDLFLLLDLLPGIGNLLARQGNTRSLGLLRSTTVDPESLALRLLHLRNEFAERFQPVCRVARSLNKDERQVSAKRNGGMRGKKRKRSVD